MLELHNGNLCAGIPLLTRLCIFESRNCRPGQSPQTWPGNKTDVIKDQECSLNQKDVKVSIFVQRVHISWRWEVLESPFRIWEQRTVELYFVQGVTYPSCSAFNNGAVSLTSGVNCVLERVSLIRHLWVTFSNTGNQKVSLVFKKAKPDADLKPLIQAYVDN